MNIKSIVICLYLMLIYWLSLHFSSLHMMFFPTLGAFSLLFISRSLDVSEISKIAAGAIVSSFIGTVCFQISPGMLSLFGDLLLTIWLINKFKWNAPPILAVSILPFFTHPANLWSVPLAVCASMLGLIITLFLVSRLETRLSSLPAYFIKWRVWDRSK